MSKKKQKKEKRKDKSQFNVGRNDVKRDGCIELQEMTFLKYPKEKKRNVPNALRLAQSDAGVVFGTANETGYYIGMPQGEEGNILVIGGNGSGKSAGIAMPTLWKWRGAICATDVKGELSEYYKKLYQQGLVTRPYIIFDPTDAAGPSYDPFWWPQEDDEANLLSNIWAIAMAVIPVLPHDNQPFWVDTERGTFAAALLYYFKLGLSFSEAICQIMGTTLSSLCKALAASGDIQVKMLLGEAHVSKKTMAIIDRGLRNKLMHFAADPYISHAFRGERENADCFSWNDLNDSNIFLRIPANRIEQWSGAINLMYTQLIRHLERRPEQYSTEGQNNVQTLLLMDEFARFGRLEMITAALSTLRSKNVNICLMVQSVAQLDKIYGEYDRRVIFDNCQYQAILRANDAESESYLSGLTGTCIRRQHGVAEQVNNAGNVTGYSSQISEVLERNVYPHEFSTLSDVLLLTPYGFSRVEKLTPNTALASQARFKCFNITTLQLREKILSPMPEADHVRVITNSKMNEGVRMLTIDERSKNASEHAATTEHQRRVEQKIAQNALKKKNRKRNYIIGEMVTQFFPELKRLEPGTQKENEKIFAPLKSFLVKLASDRELMAQIKTRAGNWNQEADVYDPSDHDV